MRKFAFALAVGLSACAGAYAASGDDSVGVQPGIVHPDQGVPYGFDNRYGMDNQVAQSTVYGYWGNYNYPDTLYGDRRAANVRRWQHAQRRDRDGDGVPDVYDRHPDNPYRR